ncbi:MAG: 50S ribosomal protein L17 [bacterium]|nr:50S ribosomal protein L17 [bacterium]
MHRHGYKGRKFHREKDQRNALLRSLCIALIENGKIETTHQKAKELSPYVEKLITKAKKNNLTNRRQIIDTLSSVSAGHKLVDELGPKLQNRNSGYTRVEKTTLRRGDNAQLSTISIIFDEKKADTKTKAEKSDTTTKKDKK